MLISRIVDLGIGEESIEDRVALLLVLGYFWMAKWFSIVVLHNLEQNPE